MNKGVATFTLDFGTCPPWLFERMVKLGRAMTEVIIDAYGPEEYIRRLSDPVWFQSLGTVLAFDWNASGLTTILTAALKEAIRDQEEDLGIFIAGGKGKTSKRTPEQIQLWGERLRLGGYITDTLVYNSKMAAKVDSALVQDGYQLYHHTFFFTRNGSWTVVQQGMNTITKTARRYHWHETPKLKNRNSSNKSTKTDQQINMSWRGRMTKQSHRLTTSQSLRKDCFAPDVARNDKKFDLINEPHSGIASQVFGDITLNLTASRSKKARDISTELLNENYQSLHNDIQILRRHSSNLSKSITLKSGDEQLSLLQLSDEHFSSHPVILEDLTRSKYLDKVLQKVHELKPKSYEQFLATEGVGPLTTRALALVTEIIYGAPPSYEDPARYSFAHGGKDAIPYPVDKNTYDMTIQALEGLIQKTNLPGKEKDDARKRLTQAGS